MAAVTMRRALINGVAMSGLVPTRYRWRVLRLLGVDVEPSRIYAGSWFGSYHVTIGEGTFINRAVMFDSAAPIILGERVSVGFQVTFCTSTHEIAGPDRRAGRGYSEPIIVADGAWIGARATIMPGVAIGAGSVIAAGSVVTRDCKPDSLYAGVPARFIRDLEEQT